MSSSISRNLQCHSGLLCSAFVMASPCTDPVSCILYPWPCQTNRSARWYSYPKTLFSNWPQSDICWFSVSLCCIINRKLGRLNKERVSRLHNLIHMFSFTRRPTLSVSSQGAMLRQILLNSTDTPDFDLVLVAQSTTHAPSSLNASHGGSVSVDALLRPTTGRGGGGLREGELHKPDLITYIVMCLLLFLLVLLIVFFINCQLRNSFFASMPYDRSLREARTSYK